MATDLTLRRYASTDADDVWAVHEAALRASPLPFVEDSPTDQDLHAIEETYLATGGEFLVGTVASADSSDATAARIVAIGGFRPVDAGTAELRRMRVHPAYQRQGFGRRTLEALEQRAREAGFDALELETVEHLRAALALYRDAGYDVVGRDEHPETGDELLTLRVKL